MLEKHFIKLSHERLRCLPATPPLSNPSFFHLKPLHNLVHLAIWNSLQNSLLITYVNTELNIPVVECHFNMQLRKQSLKPGTAEKNRKELKQQLIETTTTKANHKSKYSMHNCLSLFLFHQHNLLPQHKLELTAPTK